MSRTSARLRPATWGARFRSAQRRFILYQNVEVAIAQEGSIGGKVLKMVWRRPAAEISLLLQTGGHAIRELSHRQPESVERELIERLEGVVTQLAAADDWAQRLHAFLRDLRTESARRALTALVRLGCVPHELVQCLQTYTNPSAAKALREQRQERLAYLPRLQRLQAAFVQLADDCDAYTHLRWRYSGSNFRVDCHAAAFLRDEAAVIGEFIRDADPRRAAFTLANNALQRMMRDIKTITGGFQDPLVAQLLNGIPGVAQKNAEVLKKVRRRLRLKDQAWTTPRYLTRPASRIVMEDNSAGRP